MQLKAEKREITGKKVKNLRLNDVIPAVLFEPKKDSINVQVDYNTFVKAYKEAGETEVIEITVGSNKYPVMVEEVQFHPVTGRVSHVNFRIVNLKQKIKVNVPVVFINEEIHPLLKNGNAILLTPVNELEVEALPNDLPKEFELDSNELKEIGDTLTLKQIKKLVDLSKIEFTEEDEDLVIATLDYAVQQEEIKEEEPQSVDDVQVTEQKSPEELAAEAEKEKKEEKK